MKKDNVIIRPITNTFIINFYSLTILIKEIPVSLETRKLIAVPFIILIKGVRKRQNHFVIFKVSLEDM